MKKYYHPVHTGLSALFAFILITVSLNLSAQSISISFTASNYSGYNISCHGASNGFVQATVTGGTAPYTYLWNTGGSLNNLANLSAGTYILTVTDSLGATTADTAVLSEPNALTVLLSSPSCHSSPDYNICNPGNNAGTIYSTITGGAGGYAYSWSSGDQYATLSNAPAGDYALIITDNNNCIDSGHITIHEPPYLRIAKPVIHSIGSGHNSCVGQPGNIQFTLAGGIPPYSNIVLQTTPPATVNSYDSSGTEIFNIPYNVTYISVGLLDSEGNEVDTAITLSPAPPISVTVTPFVYSNDQNLSCHYCSDGSMKITASAGTEPYVYQWYNSNNSLINTGDSIGDLTGGNYYAIVTDSNGCSANSGTITLVQPAYIPLSISMNSTGTNCNGNSTGSMNIAVTGGTQPYTYLWSNGATTQNISNISAGNYTVTVHDARNDSSSATLGVSQPTAMGISLSNSIYRGYNIPASGGSDGTISATVTGGTSPYRSYSWSNGSQNANLQNLIAGAYTLIVTDANGCTASASDTLTQPDVMKIDSVSSPLHNGYNESCNAGSNGSINLSVSGGVPAYHFNWSNGQGGNWNTQNVQNAPAGIYTVQIVDANGNELDTAITLTQPIALNVSLESSYYQFGPYGNDDANVSCFGCHDGIITTNASGGTAPYSYLWSGSNLTSDSIGGLGAGQYSVTLTDNNGCTMQETTTLTQPGSQTLQIASFTISSFAGGYNVSGNGTSDGGITNVIVVGGTPPYSYSWDNGHTTESLTNISAGFYSLEITDADSNTYARNFILRQPNGMFALMYPIEPSTFGGSDGSIFADVVGGTPPYTFAWTNTGGTTLDTIQSQFQILQQLSAGSYNLTVTDANGNMVTQSALLNEPPPLHVDNLTSPITAHGYNVTCNGGSDGSINLTVSGGSSPYQFTWDFGSFDPNPSGLSAGTYNVRIVDNNGAEVDTSVTLNQPDPLSDLMNVTTYIPNQSQGGLSLQGGANVSCQGCKDGSVGIDLSGGVAPYTYTWTYNSDCMQQLLQQVGGGGQLSQGGGLQTNSNGGATVFSTGDSLTNLGAGFYTVVVLDANGCELDDATCLTDGPQESWSLGGNANVLPSQFLGTTDSTDLVFKSNNSESMRVGANGNIGIGTVTPEHKLDVCGSIRAKEVLVEDSNWCDFVFEDSYQRMGLLEKENYLKSNKHLPYMLPAKDVAQNGLKIGSTVNGITQNVEEMNLDMIELYKMIESLKKENDLLKEKIATIEEKFSK